MSEHSHAGCSQVTQRAEREGRETGWPESPRRGDSRSGVAKRHWPVLAGVILGTRGARTQSVHSVRLLVRGVEPSRRGRRPGSTEMLW